MAKTLVRATCTRCGKGKRYFHVWCIDCLGVLTGHRCADCGHDRTYGHGRDGAEPCSSCSCPAFVRSEETA